MKRIGVFVDLSNLYFCIGKKYRGKKLDYKRYYDFIADLGTITVARAYGAAMGNEADRFITKLKAIGFDTHYKTPREFKDADEGRVRRKADWDVGIAVDIIKLADRLDTLVLGSADGDMAPVVAWCMDRGVKVIVIASTISDDLKNSSNEFIEIPESLLEGAK